MSNWTGLLAQLDYLSTLPNLMTRAVAAVGGFVVGGLGTGIMAWLIVRVSSDKKKIPGWAFNTIRLLGGIAFGWLAFILVGIGGGNGPGGSGGWPWGPGGGPGTSDKDVKTVVPKEDKKQEKKPPPIDKPSGQQPLEVEVLGNDPVEAIAGQAALMAKRYYRVPGQNGSPLLTLKQVKELLIDPEGEPKWRHILLVLYVDDGPDKDVKRVSELRQWAENLHVKNAAGTGKVNLKVDVVTRAGTTPLK